MVDDDQLTTVDEHEEMEDMVEGTGTTALRVKTVSWWWVQTVSRAINQRAPVHCSRVASSAEPIR